MNSHSNMIARGLKHIWHPCSQMKDYEIFKPLDVIKARDCYFELRDGRKVIDAISSWWCKSLGHNHPRLKQAVLEQLDKFEHVILANTTNETIVTLSEKLSQLTNSLNKVFYASDGSCAIEIAMKMSLHAHLLKGEAKRKSFIALANGYHGETTGALSVSDVGIYRQSYSSMLFDVHFLSPIPYVLSSRDPLWMDCSEQWPQIEKQLDTLADTTTAILIEPIVQGASGMKIYSQDFLKRLRQWTKERGIHLIADEIMTGIGRTGKMLACEHANVEPDFLCLAKGLTAGWLPLSAVLTKESIYRLFYDDYAKGKSFLHSHTHSGNTLAASVASAVLDVVTEEKLYERANEIGGKMYACMQDIADETKRLMHVRQIGAIVAADLVEDLSDRSIVFNLFRKATELGALLRPLGNTIYWLPPLTIDMTVIDELKKITRQVLVTASN